MCNGEMGKIANFAIRAYTVIGLMLQWHSAIAINTALMNLSYIMIYGSFRVVDLQGFIEKIRFELSNSRATHLLSKLL